MYLSYLWSRFLNRCQFCSVRLQLGLGWSLLGDCARENSQIRPTTLMESMSLTAETRSCGGRLPVGKVRGDTDGALLLTTINVSLIVFRVPTTHDVFTTLFHPAYPKSHLDILNLSLLGSQLVLFYLLPRSASKVFFFFYFTFWRAAYDAGLGWVLTKQSKRKWIVREIQRLGWLDRNRKPAMRNWIRAQLAIKMGKDYSFDVGDDRAWLDRVLIGSVPCRNFRWNIILGSCSGSLWTLFS